MDDSDVGDIWSDVGINSVCNSHSSMFY